MFETIGKEEITTNIGALLAPYTGSKNDFRKAYSEFLNSFQTWLPPTPEKSTFIEDPIHLKALLKCFNEESELSDIKYSLSISEQNQFYQSTIKEKLELFNLEHPDAFCAFEFVIHSIFSAPSKEASGGTTSGAIGALWINARNTWTSVDYLEFFLHELTHTLMFLDERRYRHYKSLEQITKKENYAHSAILKRARPVDKVLHSLVVAVEVLGFRNQKNNHHLERVLHPPTQILIEGALAAAQSLKKENIKNLLTPRGLYILGRCCERLFQLDDIFDSSSRPIKVEARL